MMHHNINNTQEHYMHTGGEIHMLAVSRLLVSGLTLEGGDFQAIGIEGGRVPKLRLATLTYNRNGICPDQTHFYTK